jgi:hypothetical protein
MKKRRQPAGSCARTRLAICLAVAGSPPAAWAGTAPAAAPPVRPVQATSSSATDPYPQCLSDLKAANVQFHELGRVTKDACVEEGAVELDAVASPFGTVSAPGKPTLTCPFARQFADWVRDVSAPLTLAYMGSRLTAIQTGPGLVCRTRYDKPGEKISEHAKGNAIDVMAFALENGKTLTVKDSSASAKIDGVLMKTFRATGCGYFTTILGPGSDDAHKDHFHFDLGLHGATANYRICE